jgi:hypothetical protein
MNNSIVSRITIEPTRVGGERGQRYRVYFEGTVLVEDTRDPEHDAARALLARGIRGQFETWRLGGSHPSVRGDIEACALLTTEESAKIGPRVRSWRTYDGAGSETRDSQGDVSGGKASKSEPAGKPALAQKAANDATFPPESDAA